MSKSNKTAVPVAQKSGKSNAGTKQQGKSKAAPVIAVPLVAGQAGYYKQQAVERSKSYAEQFAAVGYSLPAQAAKGIAGGSDPFGNKIGSRASLCSATVADAGPEGITVEGMIAAGCLHPNTSHLRQLMLRQLVTQPARGMWALTPAGAQLWRTTMTPSKPARKGKGNKPAVK